MVIEQSSVERILALLPIADAISYITPLMAGFSSDEKFVLAVDAEPRYVLRISPLRQAARRRAEFALLSQLAAAGIPVSPPCLFEALAEFDVCVSVLGYINGRCAEEALSGMDASRQYVVGVDAGKTLQRMHAALLAPAEIDWHATRWEKYQRCLKTTREQQLHFAEERHIEHYIATSHHLMRARPVAFLHDDYHPGNLIVSDGHFSGVIDLNRCDWGDPYHDFYKVAHFSAPRFPCFARGQIDGYFNKTVPAEFWRLYTLYVAMSLHVDLLWTRQYWPQRFDEALERNSHIRRTHDFHHGTAPLWYSANCHE